MTNSTTFDKANIDQTYSIFVDGERRGCVWFARGVKEWAALVRVSKKSVPRSGEENTIESLLVRVRKDFKKSSTVEFRLDLNS